MSAIPDPPVMPSAYTHVDWVIIPEIFDNIGIALVMMMEMGSYFDAGFNDIKLWEIAAGVLFIFGFAANIYLFCYNQEGAYELWNYNWWINTPPTK